MNSCTSNTLEMVCFDYFNAKYSCCRHAIERLHFTMRAKNKLDIAYHWKTSKTSYCMMGNRLNAAFGKLIDIKLCWICNMRLCSSVSAGGIDVCLYPLNCSLLDFLLAILAPSTGKTSFQLQNKSATFIIIFHIFLRCS